MGTHNSKCVGAKEKRDLIKLIESKGYKLRPNSSGHSVYKNEVTGKTVVLTHCLNKMVYRRILKEVMANG